MPGKKRVSPFDSAQDKPLKYKIRNPGLLQFEEDFDITVVLEGLVAYPSI